MDLDQIEFNQDALVKTISDSILNPPTDELLGVPVRRTSVAVRLGDIWEHPSFFESYPELQDFKVNFHISPAGEGGIGAKFEVDGKQYALMGDGVTVPETGAQFLPAKGDAAAEVDIFGTSHEDPWKRTQEALAHEIEHFVQNIEGFSRGGSPQEFRDMAPVQAIRGNNVRKALLDDNGLDTDDINAIGEALMFDHGTWLNSFDPAQWDDITIRMQRWLKRVEDPLELGIWEKELNQATENFTQVIKWYRGTDNVEDMERIINEIDLGLVDQMANDIYFSLEGEGMSRLAEAVWSNRKSLPENFNPGEGFMNQLKQTQETVMGTMEAVPGGQVRIPNEGAARAARSVDASRDAIEEELRALTDSELMERLEAADPKSKVWTTAVDWFGEARLIELGLLE